MSNLQYWQQKIQEKRKQTPWRDFVMEICSWYPMSFYKNNGQIAKYDSKTHRINNIVSSIEYETIRNNSYDIGGVDYDSGKNFLNQLQDFCFSLPHEALKQFQNSENSDFVDICFASKNCYLSSCVLESENVLYSMQVKGQSKNILNSTMTYDHCEVVVNSKCIIQSYQIFYSSYIQNCNNLWFCSNMIGCRECINCNGLVNQSYCIDNISLGGEQYEIKKQEILQQKQQYDKQCEIVFDTQGMNLGESIDGSYNIMCETIEKGYMNYYIKNARNVIWGGESQLMENIYDGFSVGCGECHNYYGVMGAGYNATNLYCCVETAVNSHNCYYSYYLESCSFCLGCIGIKNKSYCILNKQYRKEEWYEKVDEIFAQMDQDGTLGQFFPASMNPFYFNDTAAYLIDPSFTKEEVTAKGYLRRDEPIKVDIPVGATLVSTDELGQYEGFDGEGERHIDPSIKDKIIQDEQGNVYRIVSMEYDFLMKYGLPLPRKHWLDRMRENFRIS